MRSKVTFDSNFPESVLHIRELFSDNFLFISQKMYTILCAVILPLLLSQRTDAAAVISIDLGSEWMKIGIVSPGVPMEIVLNKESKRKTPAVVAFRDGVRTFGEDAVTVGVRFPKNAYKFLLDLLGKPYDHPLVKAYRLVMNYLLNIFCLSLCFAHIYVIIIGNKHEFFTDVFRERFPYYDLVATERGTPVFIHDENTKFTPEELVAQLLAKAKEFAEISHGTVYSRN